MTGDEIRQKYLDFFKSKGHAIIKSASLIPENDPSSLFTSSGMQPLVPYLMGEKHPGGRRLADIQKCFRAGDIEEIGDNRHTTCFEMMGNWSLGDYFKREQLNWYWEFLTKEMKLEASRLYVTVFSGNKEIGIDADTESAGIWKKIFNQAGIGAGESYASENAGIRENERIFYYDESKNWWSRSGAPGNMPIGEIGGPDSEVFYDMGAHLKRHENSPWRNKPCHVNCDCGRFIEVGNSVFIEFIKTESGFKPLPNKNVDFGGGLERLAMIKQGKENIFETDLYINSIKKIEDLSGKKYRENIKAFEVIADHIKGAAFIMGDDKGVAPSNVDSGYIVRRLLRRAVRFGRLIGIKDAGWTSEVARTVIKDYSDRYGELKKNSEFIFSEMGREEKKFHKTLAKGERLLKGENIDGRTAFNLFQTYGYPKEMTEEIAEERGIKLSRNFNKEYKEAKKKHQNLSRTAAAGKFKGGLADAGEETTKLHTAAHLLLAALRKVLGDDVAQKGSNITAERLRFDFSCKEKLTDEQKKEVEKLVNEAIAADLPVKFEEMGLDEAKARNATGVFESKYGEKVKVYTIGQGGEEISKEICGGPHVERTGVLGKFRIKKEQSSSAGVRRIKATLE